MAEMTEMATERCQVGSKKNLYENGGRVKTHGGSMVAKIKGRMTVESMMRGAKVEAS